MGRCRLTRSGFDVLVRCTLLAETQEEAARILEDLLAAGLVVDGDCDGSRTATGLDSWAVQGREGWEPLNAGPGAVRAAECLRGVLNGFDDGDSSGFQDYARSGLRALGCSRWETVDAARERGGVAFQEGEPITAEDGDPLAGAWREGWRAAAGDAGEVPGRA